MVAKYMSQIRAVLSAEAVTMRVPFLGCLFILGKGAILWPLPCRK
jgi:hypothetical protein